MYARVFPSAESRAHNCLRMLTVPLPWECGFSAGSGPPLMGDNHLPLYLAPWRRWSELHNLFLDSRCRRTRPPRAAFPVDWPRRPLRAFPCEERWEGSARLARGTDMVETFHWIPVSGQSWHKMRTSLLSDKVQSTTAIWNFRETVFSQHKKEQYKN